MPRNQKLTKVIAGRTIKVVTTEPGSVFGSVRRDLVSHLTLEFASGHIALYVNHRGGTTDAELGMESPVPAGAFFDVFPLSVMTTSTLARLNELRP